MNVVTKLGTSRSIANNLTDPTGALLDRLTHHVHILTMNADIYRLRRSAGRRRPSASPGTTEQIHADIEVVDPDTGEIIDA